LKESDWGELSSFIQFQSSDNKLPASLEAGRGKNTLQGTILITGAFSFTGKYVARLLLQSGYRVRTFTSHPDRANEFGRAVEVFPYNFEDPKKLVESLRGVSALINTYWVRFPRGSMTFEAAVQNTERLLDAAKTAGVRRFVHVSIANPSLESRLGYYRGKAQVERAVRESGLSYAILRPTVIFGAEDILINNIAWFTRTLPVFAVPGDGRYKVRPIHVEDMAELLVRAAENRTNQVMDAIGPETFTFEELLQRIAHAVGKSPRIWHAPTSLAYSATRMMGWLLGDVILTWEEYLGLIDGLLAPEGPATGEIRLTKWLAENARSVGRNYSSEIARHYAPAIERS
jgi:uncharacterized protein YbjT (DUF2867 family)